MFGGSRGKGRAAGRWVGGAAFEIVTLWGEQIDAVTFWIGVFVNSLDFWGALASSLSVLYVG